MKNGYTTLVPGPEVEAQMLESDRVNTQPKGGTMTYTTLRDFLDRYTNENGEIQGDPATIAAEAVSAGLVDADDEHDRQMA